MQKMLSSRLNEIESAKLNVPLAKLMSEESIFAKDDD